ncbi:TMV resistance protein N isoform X3 [Quercus suber]
MREVASLKGWHLQDSPEPKIILDIVREVWYKLSHEVSSEDLGRINSEALWSNDVFLCFRGEDTRNSFIGQLHAALKKKGVVTFRDDENLERGKSILEELFKAIEKSRFAIVILSKNFATSTWCLEELAKIIECMKEKGMTVLPTFYNVDPSNVRKQTGFFAQAFIEHEERFKENKEKVQTWRDALREVANLFGWYVQNRPDLYIVQNIVEELWHKLRNSFLEDTKDLVGIISRWERLMLALAIGSNDVRIIGVWGMGGIGKTTLARVVFRMVSNKFEACCFLDNVREVYEKGALVQLQQQLITQILDESMSIQDVDIGVLTLKTKLRHKKILIVLDDINQLDQLDKLVGKHGWLGPGSRVIITTRDVHLLKCHKVDKIYEIERLNYDEAFQLFNLKAFGKKNPTEDYLELSQAFVHYASGLPLAIEVLGSLLLNKGICEWKSALDRLKENPHREILDVLRISFDGLEKTEKEIFLYIACFFNHKNQESVIQILDCLDLCPEIGLRILIDKSLIKLHYQQLWMLDLIQEMGRYIVRQESPNDLGKRSRLWLYQDIDHVLTKNMGTSAIQSIVLELFNPKLAYWHPESFTRLYRLKVLQIHGVQLMHDPKHLPNSIRFLDWSWYPSKSLPSNFQSNELVKLCLNCSYIERLWEGTKSFGRLKFIELKNSLKLIETPDFSEVPVLQKLDLEDCRNLCKIHPSISFLKRLTRLNLKGYKNLKNLPKKFAMESLEILIFSGCSKVKKIPKFGENMKRVLELYLDSTGITYLPTSIGNLTRLASLSVRDCKNLMFLPCTFFNMKSLENLEFSGCTKLSKLLENLGTSKSGEKLHVSRTSTRLIRSSNALLENLRKRFLGGFKSRIPDRLVLTSQSGLCFLNYLDLSYCNLNAIPNGISSLFSLKYLDLSGNNFGCLPESIAHLSFLIYLHVENCTRLLLLPKLPLNIGYINAYGCTSLETILDILQPNSSIERRLYLSDCSKLVDNQDFIDMFFAVIKKHLMFIPNKTSVSIRVPGVDGSPIRDLHLQAYFSHSLFVFLDSLRSNSHALRSSQYLMSYMLNAYDIVIPGTEIPDWFSHQSIGAEVNIQESYSKLCNEWMGIAVCVVFCSHHNRDPLFCWLTANGKRMSSAPAIGNIVVLSDHIWLLYLLPQFYPEKERKSLWECDVNGFSQISIYFGTSPDLEVKKCGLRMVYKNDIEDLNRAMARSRNNNIIHHKGLDVLPQNFNNLAVVAEGNKAKETRDDCDGIGPSGEGSSDDLPHLQRIETLTKFMAHGESDCEEYLECAEERDDWQESSESDLEG